MITEKKRLWLKAYRKRNKEHIRKVSHARYVKMREQRLAHAHKMYHENPQHFLTMAKESRERNNEKIKSKWNQAHKKYKETRLIQAKTRHHFKHLLKTGSCQTCGSRDRLTFHHPTKPYKYDLFQILCRKCHGNIHGQRHFAFENEVTK